MADSRMELIQRIERLSPREGFNETPLAGVHCIRYSRTDDLANRRWRASLCLVVQGSKELVLGRKVYRDDQAHTIVTPVELPVTSRVFSATPGRPFLCLRIEFDPLAVGEVGAQIDQGRPLDRGEPQRAIFVRPAEDALLGASVRLVRLLDTPDDAAVLGPLVVREIFYHLLKGADGLGIRQFVRSGSKLHRLSQVIYGLRSNFQDDVDVEALARAANRSRSAFFKDFKAVTSLSPIQYQKRLRLLEARRLMVEERETAEGSAYRVGYRSPSQFSREYSRMFGLSPLRDAGTPEERMRAWGD